jgi:histone deacetylase 11
MDKFKPELIVYNAGTDCMQGDPLGQLNISPQGVIERDEIVFQMAFERKIPIVMVLSGGYQKSNAPNIAESI